MCKTKQNFNYKMLELQKYDIKTSPSLMSLTTLILNHCPFF